MSSVLTNAPQIAALRLKVEEVFGQPITTPSDYTALAFTIETKTKDHLSDSTIKRIWNPKLSYKAVTENVLNIICRYAGYDNFQAFCSRLSKDGIIESKYVISPLSVRSDELAVGDVVKIAWLPDRECRLKYLGDNQYIAIETLNSTIKEGDTFKCLSFVKDRPLYVDDFVHDGQHITDYAMGIEHGLTSVEVE